MIDNLDTPDADLLRRLREAAERVPAAPVARRIANRDYRVQRSLSRPILTAGVTATGFVAAGAGLVLALSAGASPAFAGWSATPTAASGAQVTQAQGTCSNSLATSQATANAGAERINAAANTDYILTHDTNWQSTLTDTRGPYTAFFFEGNDGDRALCVTGTDGSTIAEIMPRASWENRTPGAESYQGGIVGQYEDEGEGTFSLIGGQAGADVTAIVYHLENGTDVSATISDGYYLAWWPASTDHTFAEVTSVSVTNSNGTTETPWAFNSAQARSWAAALGHEHVSH